ncbi:MAG TPA: sulfotransferase family 2 domain-containing protein, partial [Nocardioides sp.]|nr:sulfotransferase family 2 domain-containing protein [Nocardioides sp.]
MLISDDQKVLFVHVPKTGGVSVEDTVKEACPDARKASKKIGRHATLGKILRNEPDLVDYWTFGFVRNPWARMVSLYSIISAWDRRHGPASGKPQDVKHG